jgi:hypothetical protein
MHSQSNNLSEQLDIMKVKYYSNHGSNATFFKNTHKLACAKEITSQIPLETLLEQTIVIRPDTNQIHVKYELLKRFACPSVYAAIIDYISNLVHISITDYDSFEMHIDLNTFTVTAANRYNDLIRMFCEKALQKNSAYQIKLNHIYLYNYPSIISILTTLFAGFVDENARGKVILVK